MNKPCIQTFTGRLVDISSIRVEDLDIEDIAHALSNLCRFTGHTAKFYSVAQHSVHCSLWAEAEGHPHDVQALALLHDGAEAYLGDIARPLKRLLPQIKNMESSIEAAIAEKFRLPTDAENRAVIKRIDNRMLATEKRDVLAQPAIPWPGELEVPYPDPIGEMLHPTLAEKAFIRRFRSLHWTHGKARSK